MDGLAKEASGPMPKSKSLTESDLRIQTLIANLNKLQYEAMKIGMVRTGHVLHEAIREVGYEYADIISGAQHRLTIAKEPQASK